MNDEQVVEYCRQLIIHNLHNQNGDFTKDIGAVLGSDSVLLGHCYDIRDLMNKCIEILQNRGVDLDD